MAAAPLSSTGDGTRTDSVGRLDERSFARIHGTLVCPTRHAPMLFGVGCRESGGGDCGRDMVVTRWPATSASWSSSASSIKISGASS